MITRREAEFGLHKARLEAVRLRQKLRVLDAQKDIRLHHSIGYFILGHLADSDVRAFLQAKVLPHLSTKSAQRLAAAIDAAEVNDCGPNQAPPA